MTLCVIVGEAGMRRGSSCYERIEGLQMTKRFLQLESERTQLMPRVVRWQIYGKDWNEGSDTIPIPSLRLPRL